MVTKTECQLQYSLLVFALSWFSGWAYKSVNKLKGWHLIGLYQPEIPTTLTTSNVKTKYRNRKIP